MKSEKKNDILHKNINLTEGNHQKQSRTYPFPHHTYL